MKGKDAFLEHLPTANVWPQQVRKGFHREHTIVTKGTCRYNSDGGKQPGTVHPLLLTLWERFPYGKAAQEVYAELVLSEDKL